MANNNNKQTHSRNQPSNQTRAQPPGLNKEREKQQQKEREEQEKEEQEKKEQLEALEQELLKSPTMSRLLSDIREGIDIGRFGRLVFTMVARHFLAEEEILSLLAAQPNESEESAKAMVFQVKTHNYNPPKRDRILQWQSQQEYKIIQNAADPLAGNLYHELRFPDKTYNHILQFWSDKAKAAERLELEEQQSESR